MIRFFLTLHLLIHTLTICFSQSYLGHTTTKVNFRAEANTNCEVLESLKTHTQLFVISKEKVDGFYHAINIESNVEGYVHANYVALDKALPRNENGILDNLGQSDSYNPKVTVHNNTKIEMTLKFGDKVFAFDPNEKMSIEMTPGTYTYRASAPGVIPDYGYEVLQSNYNYSWEFIIVTTRY